VTCGFLHTDKLYRDSLVYDAMELHRASVDHLVLKLLATLTLAKGDCMSTSDGSIKFNPQLARYIAATCRLDQKEIDTSAKWLREYLLAL
jgi:CRISPR/Cas system-associated endonuclease Cas1